jgi:hypothetical protein
MKFLQTHRAIGNAKGIPGQRSRQFRKVDKESPAHNVIHGAMQLE